jgi:peptidylprolyl isomerase
VADKKPRPRRTSRVAHCDQKRDRAVPPEELVVPAKARVVLQTSRGPITLELDGKAAPLHVKSFLYLADAVSSNGTNSPIHADLLGDGSGFIIQGGDPLSKSDANRRIRGRWRPGYEIPRERNKLTHQKCNRRRAFARPDSAGSQFYITQGDRAVSG